MKFEVEPFNIRILNMNEIVHTMEELVSIAGEFVWWQEDTMKGKHKVIVSTKRLKYEFELRRNLTIIQGNGATGKTTLVDMIRDFVNNPSGTPVEVIRHI